MTIPDAERMGDVLDILRSEVVVFGSEFRLRLRHGDGFFASAARSSPITSRLQRVAEASASQPASELAERISRKSPASGTRCP